MGGESSRYLQTVYDAALSDEHWPRALALLSEQIPAVGAFLIAVDQVGLSFHIEQSSYPLDQLRHYFENYGHFDEDNLTRVLAQTPPLRLLRDCDVWGDIAALEERPDYKWMRENIGARRKAGARLSQGKGWFDLIALQFDSEWTPVKRRRTVDQDRRRRVDHPLGCGVAAPRLEARSGA